MDIVESLDSLLLELLRRCWLRITPMVDFVIEYSTRTAITMAKTVLGVVKCQSQKQI